MQFRRPSQDVAAIVLCNGDLFHPGRDDQWNKPSVAFGSDVAGYRCTESVQRLGEEPRIQ